jgi:hypothetical protein
MKKFICITILCILLAFLAAPGVALAGEKPPRSEKLTAGPYVIALNLFQDPPEVEQPLDVSVVCCAGAHLSGRIVGIPGPGTDGVIVRANLTPDTRQPGTLVGSIHLPVRGAWRLVVNLNGSRGHGTASLDVTVTAPNAIPTWLGWLIGLSPLVGCAWLARRQWRYRRTLLRKRRGSVPAGDSAAAQ